MYLGTDGPFPGLSLVQYHYQRKQSQCWVTTYSLPAIFLRIYPKLSQAAMYHYSSPTQVININEHIVKKLAPSRVFLFTTKTVHTEDAMR